LPIKKPARRKTAGFFQLGRTEGGVGLETRMTDAAREIALATPADVSAILDSVRRCG
jgi:hypothetical protein